MNSIYNEEIATCKDSWKNTFFLLVDIDLFIVFLEQSKTKGCRVDNCRSSIFKKDKRNNEKKVIVPFIKLKSAEKGFI